MTREQALARDIIARARDEAERIAATRQGREAARLSFGTPELEAVTRALFGQDV